MRKYLTTAMAIALMSGVSYADLQNVEVGGDIRIRGNTFENIMGAKEYSTNQWTEQRTELNVTADFSDEVSAFIAFDSYNEWGTGTGYESETDINLNEAYIHLGDAVAGFDLKIGRQEVLLGSEFIIGNNNTAGGFDHMSFDGIRADYAGENFNVTLLSLKVYENDAFGDQSVDNDEDLYAIYGTYTGLENHTIDGYVFLEREGEENEDNDELFTYGVRAAGAFGGGFDYELELAMQTGEYDDGEVDYEGTAINAELGYTFDSNMQPRVFVGVAQFTGSDEDDELGFIRNYSDWEYSEFLADGELTNVLILRAGVSANVTEKIGLSLIVSSFEYDDEDGRGDYTGYGEDDLGTEIGLYMTYQYSEDVAVELGVARFMNGDAIEEYLEDDGYDEGDQTYLYAEISLSF